MEYEKTIPFKNWTTEDFEGKFGRAIPSPNTTVTENHTAELLLDKPYTFKAGGTYSVPQSQALHFAKQLAVRELHLRGYNGNVTRGEMLSENDVKEYMEKCFPIKPSEEQTTNTFERIDITEAKDAAPVKENKTDKEVQNEKEDDEDDNAADEKNNAGAPQFKRSVGRPRTKDREYVA